MRFQLFHCQIVRSSGLASAHVVAASEEHAKNIIEDRDRALCLTHLKVKLRRVDNTLPENRRDGLDVLLEHAPAGFASYCDLGWIAHVAPLPRLGLFRSEDHRGMEILAVAPSADVAAALFVNTQLPQNQHRHVFQIVDVTDSVGTERDARLAALIDTCQVGIADFDEENDCWFVW